MLPTKTKTTKTSQRYLDVFGFLIKDKNFLTPSIKQILVLS